MASIRVQQPVGALSQMWAGLTHSVSPDRLRTIARNVPYVVLATGDEDHLVSPSNSVHLASCMPGAELVQWENTGHAVQLQRTSDFNALIERAVAEGRRRCSEESSL
jgi:pimeloyl-ACP methyl ester carboxylesterase